MDDKTYRRLFQETRRQTYIRHNFPYANYRMTKSEREQHERLVKEHKAKEKSND